MSALRRGHFRSDGSSCRERNLGGEGGSSKKERATWRQTEEIQEVEAGCYSEETVLCRFESTTATTGVAVLWRDEETTIQASLRSWLAFSLRFQRNGQRNHPVPN